MSLDNIAQYFDFTNVSNIINMIIIGVGVLYNLKLKVNNIVAKAREDKANEELEKKDVVIGVISEVMLAQNQALVEIVMASKLPNDSKIRVVNSLQKVNDKANEVNLSQIYDKAKDVAEDIKDITKAGVDTFHVFKDILGNPVKDETTSNQ